MLASDAEGAWLVETPHLEAAGNGAGDMLAALLLGRLLQGSALADALAGAVSSTFGLIEAGAPGEPALVGAQERIVDPPGRFAARAIG